MATTSDGWRLSDTGAESPVAAPPISGRMLYTPAHVLFIFASTLDIVFTWVVLLHGGREVNPFAAKVLMMADIGDEGLLGLSLYKFSLVALVVVISELLGRKRYRLGCNLSKFAVAITLVPVVAAMVQLAMWA